MSPALPPMSRWKPSGTQRAELSIMIRAGADVSPDRPAPDRHCTPSTAGAPGLVFLYVGRMSRPVCRMVSASRRRHVRRGGADLVAPWVLSAGSRRPWVPARPSARVIGDVALERTSGVRARVCQRPAPKRGLMVDDLYDLDGIEENHEEHAQRSGGRPRRGARRRWRRPHVDAGRSWGAGAGVRRAGPARRLRSCRAFPLLAMAVDSA